MIYPTVFSENRIYRYTLWREWPLLASHGRVMFIGLNPSTADEMRNDPTVSRCISFAKRWGFGGMCMANIFAFRATDPAMMLSAIDPVGPENDRYLRECFERCSTVIAAWGNHGEHLKRGDAVRQMFSGMLCLGKTKSGHPKHPLYLNAKTIPYPLLVQ